MTTLSSASAGQQEGGLRTRRQGSRGALGSRVRRPGGGRATSEEPVESQVVLVTFQLCGFVGIWFSIFFFPRSGKAFNEHYKGTG